MDLAKIEKIVKQYVPRASICKPTGNYHIATNAPFIDDSKTVSIIIAIQELSYVASVELIGKYINVRFDQIVDWKYDLNVGKGTIINIEFCSPNPTGPLHLGHARATLYGAAMAKLYETMNYKVTTDMYINNAGRQFDLFVNSVRHYHDSITYPDKEYMGEYVKEYAHQLPATFTRQDLCAKLVTTFKNTLSRFGIQHERVVYEDNQLVNVEKAVSILSAQGYIRVGKLKNQKVEGDMLIVSIPQCDEFVIGRPNGSYTYVGYDIGYAYGKYLEGYREQICCVGEDHIGHIHKMNAVMKCIDPLINLNVIHTAIVKFELNDELVKMSKRQGNFVTLEDVLNTSSSNAIIQTIFSYKEHTAITIDLNTINENQIYDIVYVASHLPLHKHQPKYLDDVLIQYVVQWQITLNSALHQKSIHIIYNYALELCRYIRKNQLHLYHLPAQIYTIIDTCVNILHIKHM